jgi:hypothetical protein
MPSDVSMHDATTSYRMVANVVDFPARMRQAKARQEQAITISRSSS